jgi:TRAP-type C4-dicarboxylate transport system permease small subunit
LGRERLHSIWTTVGQVHDLLTQVSFVFAGLALCAFTGLMAFEVALRYLFNAPTAWSQDAIGISLCASIFLAMPYVTKTGQHSTISIVTDAISPTPQRVMRWLGLSISAIVLFIVSWLSLNETTRQFTFGIQTASSIAIPKWPITAMIAYGLFSSALYMLRRLLTTKLLAE